MTRRKTGADVEFVCIGECDQKPTWMVEGRWNAEGEFEAEPEEMDCSECGERGEPTDVDVRVADI